MPNRLKEEKKSPEETNPKSLSISPKITEGKESWQAAAVSLEESAKRKKPPE